MILIGLRPRLRKAWNQRTTHGPAASDSERATRDQPSGARNASPPRELFSADDAVMCALLLHLLPIAWRKKPEAWPAEAMKVSRDLHAHFGRELVPFTSRIPSSLVEISGQNVKELSVSLFAAYVLEKLEVLASWLGRYRPSNLRLEGVSRLQEALKQGHGAVLWCESCNSSSLLLKATLESAGFQVHQLSRPGHNLSNTRFGMRFLNPIVRKAEDRYLAERILVDETNTLAVSRRIMDLLKDNGVVSVTVHSQGSQVIESPVLDGVLRVATGAPHFALRSGAPLLPLFSYRDGDEYVVEIGEPIPLAGMGRERAYEFAVGELARRLSDYVEEHPLDWCGWLRGGYSGPVP